MSDIQTVVTDSQDEVPDYPIVPCEVTVCALTDTPHPTDVVGQVYVRYIDDSGNANYRYVVGIVNSQWREVYDENNYRHVMVHEDALDDHPDCEWCGDPVIERFIYPPTFRHMLRRNTMLCGSCREDSYTCDNCSDFVHCDNVYHLDYGDYSFCESCYYESTEQCDYCDQRWHVDDEPQCSCESGMIQSYSTKFSPLFFHTVGDDGGLVLRTGRQIPERERNDIFMGLEFEMENISHRRRTNDIADLFRPAYESNQLMLKHDGSISDGFELVSQPHSLDAFMQHFPWHLIQEAQSQGMRGWDVGHREIGIHIHVNRGAFYTRHDHRRNNASPHLLGFMTFIYKNVPSIKRIAGRNVQYGHMSEAYLDEAYDICRHGRMQSRRTLGINVQNNDTVELRMFRSTMRVDRVKAYLQFVEAAVRYTQTDRVSKMRDRFNFRQFATWCSFQERYNELNKLIDEVDAVSYAAPISIQQKQTPDDYSEFVPCNSDENN